MDKVAVLIPCYNERATIGKVVADFLKEVPEAKVYVYDNNSTDGTSEIARRTGAIVRSESQQGKGNVVRRMFAEIDAECYLMVDGDDTYPVDSAREMVDLVIDHQVDMVIGDRLSSNYFQENKRKFHNAGNVWIRSIINRLFSNDIKDVMTGYRAFSYRFVKTFPVLSTGFEIETEMSVHAADKNLSLKNVPVLYKDRPVGSVSKLNTFSDGFRVVKMIRRLLRNYRPTLYYGMIALFLFCVFLWFLIPVLVEYGRTGLVARFPTLIVCGFVIIAAIQSYFAGQILSSINQKNRREFEIDLIRAMGDYREKTKRGESIEL
jgi:glycosyltransferase involved in cell wall biosynthesis